MGLVDKQENDGYTALHYGCRHYNPNLIVTYLVQNGEEEGNVKKQENYGYTGLRYGCLHYNPNLQVLTYLVQNGGGGVVERQNVH